MQKITPSIWCNQNAREVADFYVSTFRDAQIVGNQTYPESGLPDWQQDMAGKELMIDLEIAGLRISLINADGHYHPNGAVNFMVNFDPAAHPDAVDYLDSVWARLIDGGQIRMELGEYPFSQRYGWVEDRFGVNWQLIVTRPENDPRPHVIPSFMFCGKAQDRCAEAVDYWCDVIDNSQVGRRVEYPNKPGSVMFSEFQLGGQWFTAMDSAVPQDFTFDGGVSFVISAHEQDEVDYLWEKLADTEQPCGWCLDQFGAVWQIIPDNFGELMSRPGSYETMLTMTKIEIDKF
ncbi:VOC family protein [Corynebacterium epidermidicanis]|uniref:PhnB-like domain-containing protein n=1 Tax=Corynebacterium epidermidicanis TaxID=1050174 RepID=A0A0G3GV28_9CORY|nr:VOC family protein [Corynebacterium epidermidicanis]AKK03388.1 hypothetical protein CEPID_07690 [Corynebacterium epidermidicanis]